MANRDRENNEEKPLAPGLYLVATPIGNLEDITLRAMRVLRSVDRIACEDTRQTQKLLNHFQIATPTISYHQHNESARTEELIAQLRSSARIAVVSDAGTPGIADPGAEIAAAAIAAGIPVFPIPGANAAITALIASGLLAASTSRAEDSAAFTFHGFLPAKEGQRRTALENLKDSVIASGGVARAAAEGPVVSFLKAVHIFYEAPHRILATLADIEAVFGPTQHIVLARELTKLHEEFLRGAVSELRQILSERTSIKGEFVLLLTPDASVPAGSIESSTSETQLSIAAEVRTLMHSNGLSEMDALKRVARTRGLSKSAAYREWQRTRRAAGAEKGRI